MLDNLKKYYASGAKYMVLARIWLMDKLKSLIGKEQVAAEENNYNFQKLTPHDNVELNVYKDAIDYIFHNKDIVNVAISGAYGAGKSSMIASYKKVKEKLRFVHVSLAHFQTTDNEDEGEVKESILEGKILNQLIHQIPSHKIPQTNFKVKRKLQTKSLILSTIFILVSVMALLHIIFFEKWSGYIVSLPVSKFKELLNPSTYKYSLLVSGGVSAVILSYVLYKVVRTQMNKNVFRKISLQGNEIEIFEESNESYFDKYLNEVLYLFENVNADVIVFEDMDRFNVNRIFERLREVNTLVNLQRNNEGRSPIRFLYLLRDDIFISKDRTKFFDYIVPVVPVVDSSNSYDQFISHFKVGDIYEKFDKNFLQGISLYIDDMRLLKNIYNEFTVYYNRLNTTELDCNKMLAIISYKNLFPRDFSDLQINQGMVFSLFANKNIYIGEEANNLEVLATKKNEEIIKVKKEHLVSIEELEDAFSAKRARLHNYDYHRRIELSKQYDEELPLRKNNIENELDKTISALEIELSNIKNEMVALQSKQLKDVITRENIDSIFKVTTTNEINVENKFHEIKGSEYFDLLKYLIRNGYIDETYPDYMTYFYENSLNRMDKIFLRSITDRKKKEFTYNLRDRELVISRIREVDFDQEETLNFDLLEHLLQTPENEKYLDRLIIQLKDTKNFEFVGAYFDTNREGPSYVRHLNKQWPELFYTALEGKHLSKEHIRLYSIYTLYYSNKDNVISANVENCLTKYISSATDYLDINDPNVTKLVENFIQLNVSFIGITKPNEELLRAIYAHSLYEINFDNLCFMLRSFYSFRDENDLFHKNYTLVRSQSESPLAIYLQNNINIYIEVFISNSRGSINDDEDVVLLILNNEMISIEKKNAYIELLQTPITAINDVSDTNLWTSLLRSNSIKYSEDNLLEYFQFSRLLDPTLIEFINSCPSQFDFSELENHQNEETFQDLFNATLICNELSDQKYKEILVSLNFKIEDFDNEGVSHEKFDILVDQDIIQMNLETLKFIREQYPNRLFYYVRKNISEYVGIMTYEELVLDEVIEILSWNIKEETKIALLCFTKEPVSIVEKNYSTAVNIHILKNNLYSADLYQLYTDFGELVNEIKIIIYGLARDNIEEIITDSLKIDNALLRMFFRTFDLNDDQKTDLFISSISNMTEGECKENLEILDLSEYKKIFEARTRPRFEVNTKNEKLLSAFKRNSFIYDFEEDPNKDGYYKLIRTESLKNS